MQTHVISDLAWERMVTAVEKVRDRLRRAVQALEQSRIPFAVVGDNAVSAWIATVDEAAMRNTPNVEIMICRAHLDFAKATLATVGFVHDRIDGADVLLDGPNAKPRDSVHLFPVTKLDDVVTFGAHRVPNLESLVRMELTSWRTNNRVNVRDLIDVGLVDASWLKRLPDELAKRLQELLDHPEG
jgi:hypothetical protein